MSSTVNRIIEAAGSDNSVIVDGRKYYLSQLTDAIVSAAKDITTERERKPIRTNHRWHSNNSSDQTIGDIQRKLISFANKLSELQDQYDVRIEASHASGGDRLILVSRNAGEIAYLAEDGQLSSRVHVAYFDLDAIKEMLTND